MEGMLAYLIGLGALLLLSAFFSGSETALFSLSRARVRQLRDSGSRSGAIIGELLEQPRKLLITILVGNMCVNVATAAILAGLAKRLLGDQGIGAAIFVTTFLLLIAGEVTPKTLAVRHAEGFAAFSARPLRLFANVIWPLRVLLRGITSAILFLLRQGRVQSDSIVTRDDLQAIVKAGAAEGVVEEHETEIVENIFEFRDINAHEIMTPRTQLVSIDETRTLRDALTLACQSEHSRIPVHKDTEDQLWGVFHVKDLPAWAGHDVLDMTVREFVAYRDGLADTPRFPLLHEAYLAPETTHIDLLFETMRSRRTHMAVLLDEYGGTAGIVTLSDLLEQLVGEMADDEQEDRDYVRKGDVVMAAGQAKIRDLNDDMELGIPLGVADTVAGYVLELVGDFPKVGQVVCDGVFEFRVVEASPTRIDRVEIRPWPAPEAREGGEP